MKQKFLEVYLPSKYTHWSFNIELPSDSSEEDRLKITFGFWKLFVTLRLWKVKPYKDSFELDRKRFGFTFFGGIILLHWNHICKGFSMPWDWTIVRHDLLYPSGEIYWRSLFKKGKKQYSWYQIFNMEMTPYKNSGASTQVALYVELVHITKDGKTQKAKIRLAGEEREWRWKWFKWSPWPRKIQRTVDCWSDIELGERAGSWKGGMLGWGCEWRHDETMEEAFWRWYANWNGR